MCWKKNNENIIIKYDGLNYDICSIDHIWHEIITDLNPHKYPKLSKFKHNIAQRHRKCY